MATSLRLRKMQLYTLGNDRVGDDLHVLLASTRRFNPDLPITVIPWDDNIIRTAEMCRRFNANLIAPNLDVFDMLGAGFSRDHEKGRRIFRKFACFFAEAEHFLFLDADCVVLRSLDKIFEAQNATDAEIIFYARSGQNRNFSFPDIKSVSARVLGNAEGFNAAFFLSRKGIFPLPFLQAISTRLLALEQNFGIKHEQAYLNYCALCLGYKTKMIQEIMPKTFASWDTNARIVRRDDDYFFHERHQPPITILHYSSPHWRQGVNKNLYEEFLKS
jgi:hypothetical protein